MAKTEEAPVKVRVERTPSRPSSKKTTDTRRFQITNRKGGAGKTAVTSNIAEVWGQLGYKVLAVDMDPNASLTRRVGVKPADVQFTLYDLLMSPEALIKTENVIVRPGHLSFDLLPGSENLSYAEPSLMAARRQKALAERLSEVDNNYDFVVIDTAGHQSFLTSLVHVYADEVVLPLEADKDHWDMLVSTLASVEKVRADGLNPNIKPRAIFVNRWREGTNFGNDVLQRLNRNYPDLLMKTLARETVRAREAGASGIPTVNYDPDGQPSNAYTKLAEFLVNE